MTPLSGVRIIDLSSVILGPYASQILGDLGADVIKVEPPEGDITRGIGPSRNKGMTPFHITLNRNKRSIRLDLKKPADREVLLRLTASADVFMHNMSARAIAGLKIGYDDLKAVNENIIYAWATGFGSTGPYAGWPAYDDIIQGASGLAGAQAALTGGAPRYVATIPADKTVALVMVYSILAAIIHKKNTGEGQEIEIPMMETMASWLLVEHQWGRVYDPPIAATGYSRILTETRNPFQTQDGWISASPYTTRDWKNFFTLIGRPEMADNPNFATVGSRLQNIAELYGLVSVELRKQPSEYWMDKFAALGIPVGPVHTFDSLMEDKHLNAVGLFERVEHPTEGTIVNVKPPVKFSRSKSTIRRQAPGLGEHTEELLAELGYSTAEIAELLK